MKRFLILLLLSLVGLASFGWAASAREDAVERLQKAADVLKEIMGTPDKGIPEEVLPPLVREAEAVRVTT